MISVLYIDDEPALLDISRRFLQRSGDLAVDVTPSAISALELIKTKPFDAIVSDYQMPEMDGIALLKEIRSRNPDLPFILFTGKGREEVVIEAINNGADFYLQKGGDPTSQFVELEHKVKQAVRRRKAEAALQESEQRFRGIAERSSDLVMILNEHGVVTYVSPSVHAILGYLPQDVIGYTFDEQVMPKEDVAKIQRNFSKNREGVPTEKISFSVRKKDGDFAVLEGQGIPILENGTFYGIQVVLYDITERMRAEQALKESESRYRAMFENTGTAMVIIEEDTTVSLANTEFLRLTGYSQEDIEKKKSWTEFVVQDDLDRMLAQHKLRREDPKSALRHYEFRLISKTGDVRTILLNIDMIPGTKKSIASLIDLTDRSQVETELKVKSDEISTAYEQLAAVQEKLRGNIDDLTYSRQALADSQQMLQSVLDTIPVCVFWKDTSLNYLGCNQQFARDSGFDSVEGVVGKSDYDMGWKEQAEQYRADDRAVIESGIPKLNYEESQTTRDGKQIWLLTSKIPLKDTKGIIRGVLGTYENITAWKLAEQENLKKSDELQTAYEQLSSSNAVLQDNYRYATEAKQAEEIQKNRAERSIEFQKALVNLATMDAPTLRDAMNNITRTGADALHTDRASVWFFSSDGSQLVCNDLYIASRDHHSAGQTFLERDFPRYFAALQGNRTIVAADAQTDENTSELTKNYLEPSGINSVLNVPIRSGRHVVGVICLEHLGQPRTWVVEEQDFAASLADFTVIVLEKARRRLAEKDLRKSENRARITQFAVEHAAEGILWFDGNGKVVYANAATCLMLGYASEEIAQISIFDIDSSVSTARWNDYLSSKVASDSLPFETAYTKKGGERLLVEVTSDYFEYAGTIFVCSFIRDISDRKRSEKALMLANQKLNLLSSVTRHDILNKLTIVLGYLELSKMVRDRDKLEDFIKKIDDTIQVIQDQIQFTRDYQDLGVRAPEWQELEVLFAKAISQLDLGKVEVHTDLSGLVIFADPLLERVVYNLLDNALRYGERITMIRASYRLEGEEMVWVVEDDGVGIPAKDKNQIFNKGFGKHTGLGLFLAREILAITGMAIMETGFPGKGARFEIIVPQGAFRTTGD
ncbi:MAG: PAS domain S-box protein [Methanoregula sp.]|nr:MAG: PAS domain S-box protein [Methanoregula sp.]